MRRFFSSIVAVGIVIGSVGFAPGVASAAPAIPTPSVSRHGTGALHDPHLRISPHRGPGLTAVSVPSAVDLSAWTVPIGDQGSVGSCVSWAISYAMNGWYSRYQGVSTDGIQFAPMYSYSQIHTTNDPDGGGTWPYLAYGIATDQGIDTQADYWQGNYDFTDLPTSSEQANAALYKAGPFTYLYSSTPGVAAVDAIESAVAAHHPVAISFPVYSAFDNLTATNSHLDASEVDTSTYRGGHEVLIVGYDSTGVKIQNSWGTWWGDNGFAYLNWDFIESYTYDATMMSGLVPTVHAPSAPTSLHSSVAGATSTLTWAAPTSDGGSAITGYRVSRDGTDAHGTGAWSTTVSAATRTFQFSSLKPGSTYHLSVQAINAVGTGPAASGTVVIARTAPAAPTTVKGTKSDTAHTAGLTWAAPSSDGGSAITGYLVSRDGTDSHGTGAWSTTVSATTRSYQFGSLKPGSTYHLRVQAINSIGTGASGSATVVMAKSAPGTPTTVRATKSDPAHTATVTWAAPAADGGSAITGYRVSRDGTDSHGTGAWSTTVSTSTRSYRFGSLKAGITYHLGVQAINAVGTGTASTASIVMAPAA